MNRELLLSFALLILIYPIVFTSHLFSLLELPTTYLAVLTYAPLQMAAFLIIFLREGRAVKINYWQAFVILFLCVSLIVKIIFFSAMDLLPERWSLLQLLQYQLLIVLPISAAVAFYPGVPSESSLLRNLIFFASAFLLIVIIDLRSLIDPTSMSLSLRSQNISNLQNANLYSSFGGATALLGMFGVFHRTKATWGPAMNVLCWICFVFGLTVLIISGSRGSLLAFLVAASLYLIIISSYKRMMIVASLAVLLLIVIFIYLPPEMLQAVETARRLARMGSDGASLARIEFYRDALALSTETTAGFLFGTRLSVSETTFVHNIFLDVLLIFGVSGLLLFLTVITKTLEIICRVMRSTDKAFSWAGALFFYYLCNLQVSGSLYTSVYFLPALMLLLSIPKWRVKKKFAR